MDTASPEAAEPPEVGDKRPAGRRPRWRLPTPVLITLAGIALSAWLLPAFTRQWDDRQKAHELKASLVAGMASASASALTSGDQLIVQRGFVHPDFTPPAVETEWSRASLQLEAKLQAYFSSSIVAQWQRYAAFVDHVLATLANNVFARGTIVSGTDLTGTDISVPRSLTSPSFERAAKQVAADQGDVANELRQTTDRLARARPPTHRQIDRVLDVLDLIDNYHQEARSLLRLEQLIATDVLAGHATGYSTTSHDLINDLLPF
jgi:hypothetical protein